MPEPRVLIATAVAGILAGSAVTTWLHSSTRGDPSSGVPSETRDAQPDDAEAREIGALRDSLAAERDRRKALERELEALRGAKPGPAPAGAPDAVAKSPRVPSEAAGNAKTPARGQKEWFDRDDLMERGIDERRAAWLNERFDDLQMSELYLRDEALRGGWQASPRYREQLWSLRSEALEALGEEDYDLMVYAAGRKNRVALSHVLAGSPAAVAGIAAGDVLLRYDDQPIFTTHDLVRATSHSELDTDVAVHIARDGATLRLYLPPGPLGVRLVPSRVYPGDTR